MDKVKVYIIIGVLVLVGLAAFIFISALGSNEPGKTADDVINTVENSGTTDQPLSGEASVNIKNSSYGPSKIVIKKGTTVTWTNQDSMEHNVSPDEGNSSFTGSELLGRNESYSFTFNESGNFTYHCTPHPFMKGTVEVVE